MEKAVGAPVPVVSPQALPSEGLARGRHVNEVRCQTVQFSRRHSADVAVEVDGVREVVSVHLVGGCVDVHGAYDRRVQSRAAQSVVKSANARIELQRAQRSRTRPGLTTRHCGGNDRD